MFDSINQYITVKYDYWYGFVHNSLIDKLYYIDDRFNHVSIELIGQMLVILSFFHLSELVLVNNFNFYRSISARKSLTNIVIISVLLIIIGCFSSI